ncbi:MAG: phosphoserine transaminase [Pseudomonadota bacterium]
MINPTQRPSNPCFSSGPCAKRPGWEPAVLKDAVLGRSHRSKPGKARLQDAIDKTREILEVPDDYRIGIVPASDTGAVELALWNLLGARGVDVLAWESFGQEWVADVIDVLQIEDARKIIAPYGELPDLGAADFDRDVVFVWNGTTSGVCVPQSDWIPADRAGLAICDATSAAFAMPLPWAKLDVVTFSWQKVLGGEAAHGVLILGPRAVERLESFVPERPLPKIFRVTKGGKLDESIFAGATINTPSMLCVEDYIDALDWARSVGGLEGLVERSKNNLNALEQWVEKTDWVEFLAAQSNQRSSTSICLKIVADWFSKLSEDEQLGVTKQMSLLLEDEGIAFDINGYRKAPPGLRIWGGATVDAGDLLVLTAWLEWAYTQIVEAQAAA